MLICLTASHKNAGFDMLERLSANAEQAAPRILDGHDALQGAVVVATCNRFEAYLDLDAPEGSSPVDAVHEAIRAVGTVAGLLNGVVIVYGRVNPVVATLATLAAYKGVAQLLSDGRAQGYTGADPVFVFLARGAIAGIPTLIWILAAVAVLAHVVLRYTDLGRNIYAVGGNDIAARLAGINLNRYKALAFAASAFIAGVSGAFTAHMYSYINYETFTSTTGILALTMVILGGMGNMLGAVIGAVALTVLPEVFRGLADYRYLFYGIVLLLLIRFRPQGLLGTV